LLLERGQDRGERNSEESGSTSQVQVRKAGGQVHGSLGLAQTEPKFTFAPCVSSHCRVNEQLRSELPSQPRSELPRRKPETQPRNPAFQRATPRPKSWSTTRQVRRGPKSPNKPSVLTLVPSPRPPLRGFHPSAAEPPKRTPISSQTRTEANPKVNQDRT